MYFLFFWFALFPPFCWLFFRHLAKSHKTGAFDGVGRADEATTRRYDLWSRITGWWSLFIWVVLLIFVPVAFYRANHYDSPYDHSSPSPALTSNSCANYLPSPTAAEQFKANAALMTQQGAVSTGYATPEIIQEAINCDIGANVGAAASPYDQPVETPESCADWYSNITEAFENPYGLKCEPGADNSSYKSGSGY